MGDGMIDMRVTKLFFDRPAVKDAMARAGGAMIQKMAAFIRTSAVSSMRTKPPHLTSKEGGPPYAHAKTGALLKKRLYFSFDKANISAVVGPVKIGNTDAPARLEHGGQASFKNPRRRERKVGESGEIKLGGSGETARTIKGTLLGKSTTVTYGKLATAGQAARANEIQERLFGPRQINAQVGPRPFMAPALKKGLSDFNSKYGDAAQRAFLGHATIT